jgi:hypothetical protein
MSGRLAWQNLVFYLPLALSLLLTATSALHLHHDHDLLDVPISIVLLIACLSFGGLGLLCNALFAPGLASVAVAAAGMLVITRQSAKLLARHLPSSETYLISRRDFTGCSGTLLLPADESCGYAQIKDREGNVHNLQCRAVSGRLAKGTTIVIVEYDEERKSFLIDEMGGTT